MPFSVLLVEDDNEWSQALCEMYEDLLKREDPTVVQARSVPAARSAMQSREAGFDLLSLDVNMSLTNREEANGIELVREASELEAAGGLVVITGLTYDDKLDIIMPEKEIPKVQAALGMILKEHFDRKNTQHLQKLPPDTPVEKSIQIFREELTRIDLLNLCDSRNVFSFREDEQLWHLQHDGKSVQFPDRKWMRAIHYLLQRASRGKADVAVWKVEQYEKGRSLQEIAMSQQQLQEEDMSKNAAVGYDAARQGDESSLSLTRKELKKKKERLEETNRAFDEMQENLRPGGPIPEERLDELREKANRLEKEIERLENTRKELSKDAEPKPAKNLRQRVSTGIKRRINGHKPKGGGPRKDGIRQVHPALADHLDEAFGGGKTPSLKFREPVKWSL